jgi:hypothetical protein
MRKLCKAAALAAFGAVLLLSGLAVRYASAHEPHPGLQFSIGVRGVPGCNTRASDVTCALPVGQTFVLEVGIDALPDDIPSYGGFDLFVRYEGVTASNDFSNDVWPDCAFPAGTVDENTEGKFVAWACAVGIPPAGQSSWVGTVGTVTFTCTANGAISMIHQARAYTDLVESATENSAHTPEDLIHAEGANTKETLTINCGQVPAQTPGIVTSGTPGGPGPTPHVEHPEVTEKTPGQPGATLEPTAAAKATARAADEGTSTAESPGGGGGSGGSSKTWVWIVIVVAGVAAVVIAGSGYWYMRGRGTPPSGGSAT